MPHYEQARQEYEAPKENLKPHYQVAVVGGGLSGIALARQLKARHIDYLLVDAEPNSRSQSVHYLTTESSASSLGLTDEFEAQRNTRELITGYARYDGMDPGLKPLESLPPDPGRPNGFVTLSKQEIKERAIRDGVQIRGKMSLAGAQKDEDTGEWDLMFQNGQTTLSTILIDATGVKARVARLAGLIDEGILDGRKVRYCYGAVIRYGGPEGVLLFADRFPQTEDGNAKEGAGWIMPLGNGFAEVVVGWEGALKDAGKWFAGKPQKLLQRYCDWFSERGIPVDTSTRYEVVSGMFSQQPLDYRRLNSRSNLLLFGEALGLNHPLNGYLISGINNHARIAADHIFEKLNGRGWNPYEAMLSGADVFYGPQVALSKKKTEGVVSGKGRAAATAKLQELLVSSLSEDGLWNAIDRGIPVRNLLAGLISHPRYAPVVATLGVEYLNLLLSDGFYQRELWLKAKRKVQNAI